MRGISTTAFGSGVGANNPFLKGGNRATPEKFAFAGVKPSLKSLLGLVGRNLGFGGTLPDFRFYGADAPVAGLPYGGSLPMPTPPSVGPTTPTPTVGGGGGPTSPYQDIAAQGEGGWKPQVSGTGPVPQIPQYSQAPYSIDTLHQLMQMMPHAQFPTPILGTLKYDQLQGPGF